MSSKSATEVHTSDASYFSQPDECRQLGLEVESQIFWVSKECLSVYSPVFKAMLYGKSDKAGKKTIPLPKKKANDVLELLRCLFPTPVTLEIDHTNVRLLLAFADEYQMAELTSRCCAFFDIELLKLPDGDQKLLDILTLASKHRLRRILFSAVKKCAKCFGMEKFHDISDQLPSEVIGAIAWTKLTPEREALFEPIRCSKCFANTANTLLQNCATCKTEKRSWSSNDAKEEPYWWRCGIKDLLKRV